MDAYIAEIKIYIHLKPDWPAFTCDIEVLVPSLTRFRHRQGKLIGHMNGLVFLQFEAVLQTLTLDVVKSSEAEREILDKNQVRSPIARRLEMDIAGLIPADRNVEGVIEMLFDATQNYQNELN